MQCEKFDARMQDLLDRRERPECDAALLSHAEKCENCRETLYLQEQLFTGLEAWEVPEMSTGFAERVMTACASAGAVELGERESSGSASFAKRRTSSFGWKVIAGALAASLVIGVVVVSRWNQPNPSPGPQPDVAKQPKIEAPVKPIEIVQTPVVPEAPEAPDIAIPWELDAERALLLDARSTGRMIREVTSSLPDVPAAADERIPGLRPLTSGFSMTIGMMRRTLPGGREAPPRDEKPAPSKPQAEFSRDEGSRLV